MKLRLMGLVFCTVMALHGAQQNQKSSEPTTALEGILGLTNQGNNLVVFSHDVKPIEEKDRKAIGKLRQKENSPIMDYIVMNRDMYEGVNGMSWVKYPRSISMVAKTNFYQLKCARGLVLYYIMPDEKKSVKEHAGEIKILREAGWKVVVNAYNSLSADSFREEFPHEHVFSRDAREVCFPWSLLRSLIITGGTVVALVFLCYKSGIYKNRYVLTLADFCLDFI